jgi:hypothetical protein
LTAIGGRRLGWIGVNPSHFFTWSLSFCKHFRPRVQAFWEQDSVWFYRWFRGTKPGTCNEHLGRAVHVTAYSLEEFREKIKSRDHFSTPVRKPRNTRPSKKELNNLRALIARDLADAAIAGLSADRRFATAYNAALQAANMAIAGAGYRIMSKAGHHGVS